MAKKSSKNAAKPKRKPRGKPLAGADDPRRWKAGRPPDDATWGGTMRAIQEMTPEAIADWVSGPMADQFRKMPKGVTLKQIATMRWIALNIDEPGIGLVREWIDRTDGPVPQNIAGDPDAPLTIKVMYVKPGNSDSTPGTASSTTEGKA